MGFEVLVLVLVLLFLGVRLLRVLVLEVVALGDLEDFDFVPVLELDFAGAFAFGLLAFRLVLLALDAPPDFPTAIVSISPSFSLSELRLKREPGPGEWVNVNKK